MGTQIPMQYADVPMHPALHPPTLQQAAFVPSMQSTSSALLDQPMNSLDPMAYYEYGYGAPSIPRVQVRNDLPDAPPGAASRQHIWKSFIEGLMDDSQA